jgi:hypothetical protein
MDTGKVLDVFKNGVDELLGDWFSATTTDGVELSVEEFEEYCNLMIDGLLEGIMKVRMMRDGVIRDTIKELEDEILKTIED